jgi:hypothetical protein
LGKHGEKEKRLKIRKKKYHMGMINKKCEVMEYGKINAKMGRDYQ